MSKGNTRLLLLLLRRDANFIAQHDLSRRTLPAPVSARRNHKVANGVEIELGNEACAMAGHNEKGSRSSTSLGTGVFVREIIETENVV